MAYLATFHTHFGALTFHKRLTALGDTPVMMPVPRKLSASCGTCVKFTASFDGEHMADEDLDGVYEEVTDGFVQIFQNEEA